MPPPGWTSPRSSVTARSRLPQSPTFDMQMLVCTEGRERTLAERNRLFVRSGLELQESVRLASIGQMLVLRPVPR